MRIENMFNMSNIMGTAMQGAVTRNQIIANNIANVDTPGFKRNVVAFEDQLRDAVNNFRNTGSLDLSVVRPVVSQEYSWLNFRLDENNIDIEFEMAALYQNSVRFDTLSSGIMHHYRMISNVINMVV